MRQRYNHVYTDTCLCFGRVEENFEEGGKHFELDIVEFFWL